MDKLVIGIGIFLAIVGIGLSAYTVTATASISNPNYCGPGLYACGPQYYTATATAQPYLPVGIVLVIIAFIVMVIGARMNQD